MSASVKNEYKLILGIESSCDETAASIVMDGRREVASVLATSRELHEKTGGVVPEVAARKQLDFIVPVITEVFEKANLKFSDIDAVAVTVGPGLIGSLIVGVEAAKAFCLANKKPLIPINHLVGHIYANYIHSESLYTNPDPDSDSNSYSDSDSENFLPALVLIVSGGHTDLVLMKDHGDLEFIGGTIDDAAGEAFDKTARLMGISNYLGGVELSKISASCTNNSLEGALPRPKIHDDDFDFSFSGLKTAVKRLVENENPPISDLCCEFETAVCDVLVDKTIKAAQKYNVKTIMLGGGVSANSQLRSRLKFESEKIGSQLLVPPINLCGDTATYIASAAHYLSKNGKVNVYGDSKDFNKIFADPSLEITDLL